MPGLSSILPTTTTPSATGVASSASSSTSLLTPPPSSPSNQQPEAEEEEAAIGGGRDDVESGGRWVQQNENDDDEETKSLVIDDQEGGPAAPITPTTSSTATTITTMREGEEEGRRQGEARAGQQQEHEEEEDDDLEDENSVKRQNSWLPPHPPSSNVSTSSNSANPHHLYPNNHNTPTQHHKSTSYGSTSGPILHSSTSGMFTPRGTNTLQMAISNYLHHHHIPKWKYRLLLATLCVLLGCLVLLLAVSLLYGFGMAYPRVNVIGISADQVVLDPQLSARMQAVLSISNPNIFPVKVAPSVCEIYSDAGRTARLGIAPVPGMRMSGHDEMRKLTLVAPLHDINSKPGGNALVKSFLTGGHSVLFASTTMSITVQGLGLIPITRKYRLQCELLHFWGEDQYTLSDCWGRFVK